METRPQHGYLVLADISGYTSFLAASELDHAHDILTELLELIVSRLAPVLVIVKLEGDAVFAHAPASRFPRGEAVLELIEATYVAFRDKLMAMERQTSCTCRACRNFPTLDLKFMVHFGEYITQNVAGIHELVGSDVNLVHRLLKNHVSETTGWRAYALLTKACLAHLDVAPDEMHEQVEQYEHLGDVKTYSLDLRARYQTLISQRRVMVLPEEAHGTFSLKIPAPPPIVWDWLNNNEKRGLYFGYIFSAVSRPKGRTGVGTRNHCAHGKEVSIEDIMDWRPFEYFTCESMSAAGVEKWLKMKFTVTYTLTPEEDSTRVTAYLRLTSILPRWLHRPVGRLMLKTIPFRAILERMASLIREEVEREQIAPPAGGLFPQAQSAT